jgi:hypothetical protein
MAQLSRNYRFKQLHKTIDSMPNLKLDLCLKYTKTNSKKNVYFCDKFNTKSVVL